jgi:hypothetical protein
LGFYNLKHESTPVLKKSFGNGSGHPGNSIPDGLFPYVCLSSIFDIFDKSPSVREGASIVPRRVDQGKQTNPSTH